MKLFVCALLVLALIASFCLWGAAVCTAAIDERIALLETAMPTAMQIPQNAEAVARALLTDWEQNSFLISMLLPHHYLDDVKSAMLSLCSYATAGEYAEWLDARTRLCETLRHLRGLLQANADNIL